MIKKWIFAAGAGIGYILGTRAGRERYEKMRMQARQVLDNPTVKDATEVVQTEATRLYGGGKQAFRDRVRRLSHRDKPELGGDGVGATSSSASTQDLSTLAATTKPSNAAPSTGTTSTTTPDYPPRG